MFCPRFIENKSRGIFLLVLFGFVSVAMLSGIPIPASSPVAHSQQQSGPVPIQPDIVSIPPGQAYRQTNLISDVAGVATLEDPFLVNPWGIAFTASSPFWVANNGTSTSTLYKGDVAGSPFVKNSGLSFITIPGGLPTGAVANGTSDFVVTSGSASGPARFIFAAITGNIAGWNPGVPAAGSTTAQVASSNPGHVYTGLAIGNNGTGNFLYAADFANGTIDVFNSTYVLQTVGFPFLDPTIPLTSGNTFHPFNIQALGGKLYVAYAKLDPMTGRDVEGPGNGYVSVFDFNGVFLGRLISNGTLNSPWGMVIAPASFGIFGGALLVGNFGEGSPSINAYNPTTGAFLGSLQNEAGDPIEIDELWAIVFGNGGNGGDPGTLYFSAGIGEEEHGLLGSLKPTTATATSLVQFSTDDYGIGEGSGHIDITVTRAGDASGSATVNYTTFDKSQPGQASQKSDYIINAGTLAFGPGETSKTFRILLEDDVFVEGDEVVGLVLSNPIGAGVGLGTPNTAALTIHDNDSSPSSTNPLEDTNFFIRQQYLDFLNREPDPGGLGYWSNQIAICGSDPICISNRRISVSAAFFLETEFQQTGFFVYRMNKVAFNRVPLFGEYIVARNQLGQGSDAEKLSFANSFVARPDFVDKYSTLTNAQYVDTLLANAGISPNQVKLFSTNLTGAQEVPPNASTATGKSTLILSVDETTAKVSLSFSGLSSGQTGAHIHGPADPGVNAPIIFPLPIGQVVDFQITLTSTQLADLKAGKYYVNVHSTTFPGGEIRGQYPSTTSFRDALVNGLNGATETRASVLQKIAESDEVKRNELNVAFVLAEYFGYLRRDPDAAGFNFWVNQINSQTPPNFRAMVCAFLTSGEYQQRFATATPRTNMECAAISPSSEGDDH